MDGTAPLAGNQTQPIPVVALDDQPIARPVKLIKMDVEGAEPLVMRGAKRLLAQDRPVILSELHPIQLERAAGISVDAFLVEMRALGYVAHTLERGSIGPPLAHAPVDSLVSIVFAPQSA